MRDNILSINKKAIYLVLILSSMFLCQNVFAEDFNAINITIYNKATGEVYYNKIIPADKPFETV